MSDPQAFLRRRAQLLSKLDAPRPPQPPTPEEQRKIHNQAMLTNRVHALKGVTDFIVRRLVENGARPDITIHERSVGTSGRDTRYNESDIPVEGFGKPLYAAWILQQPLNENFVGRAAGISLNNHGIVDRFIRSGDPTHGYTIASLDPTTGNMSGGLGDHLHPHGYLVPQRLVQDDETTFTPADEPYPEHVQEELGLDALPDQEIVLNFYNLEKITNALTRFAMAKDMVTP